MANLILISILVATVLVPLRAARDPSPVRGLRRAILWFVGFNLVYLLAISYLVPRLM